MIANEVVRLVHTAVHSSTERRDSISVCVALLPLPVLPSRFSSACSSDQLTSLSSRGFAHEQMVITAHDDMKRRASKDRQDTLKCGRGGQAQQLRFDIRMQIIAFLPSPNIQKHSNLKSKQWFKKKKCICSFSGSLV